MDVVGSPSAARRLSRAASAALAREPLLGDRELWTRWLKAAGVRAQVMPMAAFNGAGMMLQAVEQGIGCAEPRTAGRDARWPTAGWLQLSPLAVALAPTHACQPVYPANLRDWPPLALLRQWLHDEFELSRRVPRPPAKRTRRKAGSR